MSLILNGTTGISDVDGTAAAPALTGTDTNTGIFFPAADTIGFSEGGVESARFNASGNLQTIGTISVGNATPSTSGAGITFPATQSASTDANTLDDYEEGSWTPTVSGSSTAGTGTYNAQVGRYTKIGNTVTVSAYINLASHTGSGNTTLTNLPFTVLNVSDLYSSISIGYLNNLALTATNIATGVGVFNSTKIDMYPYPIGGGAVSNVAFDAAFTIMYSLTYFTAT